MINLTYALVRLYKNTKRKIGKYYVSDLWAIENGYLSPATYTLIEPTTKKDAYNKWSGKWKHLMVQELLQDIGFKTEVRREFKIRKDILLVGRVDAMNNKYIYEIKTSDEVMFKAKDWHIHQLKCYLSMFGVEKGYIVQPIIKNNSLLLKTIGIVKMDNEWFEQRLAILTKFHEEVLKYD